GRPGGLAAGSVAQVGGEAAILAVEFLGRIARGRARQAADGRVLAPAGDADHRAAGAGLRAVTASVALLVNRHRVPLCGAWRACARRPSACELSTAWPTTGPSTTRRWGRTSSSMTG